MFARRAARLATGVLLGLSLAARAEPANEWNGFDLSNLELPRAALASGGQPRDGIPALDDPNFVPGDSIGMGFEERVVGVVIDGVARAYPRSVLVWHEAVNDRIGTRPFLIVYSPLSGTVAGFFTGHAQTADRFGVSGLLYNSGTVLFDRASESLWLPLEGEAIAGPRRGERLTPLAVVETSWADWLTRHPDTQVLSDDTGHRRPYGQDPYADYATNSELQFPVAARSDRYHPKEPVLVIRRGTRYRAYPFAELTAHDGPFTDRFEGASYRIDFNYADQRALVTDIDGKPVPTATEYWFAWHAGHPTGSVYTAPAATP
ncbi:MAG TPA: hypothetical protein DCZ11_01470 [Gammaproteobacteria bacterium]|uniref:DUF3179 domain-containing protein n=1 Tax=Immundisolibacter sp. TaxID=1934948 RepID=UPI000E84D9F1|nr:hypothetical protein [Gammaproteobacteria bacterium]HCZ47657.1 hypothetical protein [Gammaproteobacteria bacterium]MCH77095.1 hypothetical protein [Gammaproteobacteria bacterium]